MKLPTGASARSFVVHRPRRPKAVRRGTRLPLRVPVAYRQAGSTEWQPVWTLNLSRSGVLLDVAPGTLDPSRPLEFLIQLSAGGPLAGVSDVRCRGRVIRVEPTGTRMHVAVTIERFSYAAAGLRLLPAGDRQ